MILQSNKPTPVFFLITKLAVYFTLIIFIFNILVVFEIDSLYELIPEISTKLVINDHQWGPLVVIFSAFISVLGSFLLSKRNRYSIIPLVIAFLGVLFLMAHKFFADDDLSINESIVMLFVFLFHSFLISYYLLVRQKGWFSKLIATKKEIILNVQSGCNYNCNFCEVPAKVGPSTSDSLSNIINNAEQIASNGIKEITIGGDNVADFGKGELGDLEHEHTFLDLMKRLDKTGGIERIRFSTISTPSISNETLMFFKNSKRFAPFFNLELTSANNEVLKLIPKPYKREQFKDLIKNINNLIPHVYISVDITVGFTRRDRRIFFRFFSFFI
ncbi:MAG: radical SAM protein [Flavobacteriaceae bacterium]|nr:radical SAM protein [Flavobacteriaceae bacterium]